MKFFKFLKELFHDFCFELKRITWEHGIFFTIVFLLLFLLVLPFLPFIILNEYSKDWFN